MKIWTNWNLRSLAFGALSLASITGCAADVGEAQGEATATTGERVTLSGANNWFAGEDERVLAPSSSNMCFLTELYGKFRTANDRVEIKEVGTNWVLTGGAPSGSTNYGAAARCIAKSNPNKKIWQWPDPNLPPGDLTPNQLHNWNTSACFLTGLSGNFNSVNDVVRTRRADNNGANWVVDGVSNSGNIKAWAACVDNVSFPTNHYDIIHEGQSFQPPNTVGNATGPAACFLTQVGGWLAFSIFNIEPYPSIYAAYYQPPPSPGFIWAMNVDNVGVGSSGGIGCIK